MKKYTADTLAQMSIDEISQLPEGKWIVAFHDGTEIESTKRRTILSSFYWRLHREFGGQHIPVKHHFANTKFKKGVEMIFGAKVFWDVYDAIADKDENTIWRMSKVYYEIMNAIHNYTVTDLCPYSATADLGDIAQIICDPEVIAAKKLVEDAVLDPTSDTGEVMNIAFKKILALVSGDKAIMRHNGIAKLARAGLLDSNQIVQFIGPRGFVKAPDGTMYKQPITVGYADGLSTLYDSLIESRTASLSLYMNESSLRTSEYFNRQMQLLAGVISHVEGHDCGSTLTIPWLVAESDVPSLAGKYHMVDGKPVLFDTNDESLINTTIQIRSITQCINKNPNKPCKICFGELATVIPAKTNIGHFLTIEPLAAISQSILSTKHVTASLASLYLTMEGYVREWFKYHPENKSSILMRKNSPNDKYLIQFALGEATGLNRISNEQDITILPPQRISEISKIRIALADDEGKVKGEWYEIDVTIAGHGSALSTDVIRCIQRNGMHIEGEVAEVLLDDFKNKEVFITPRRNEDMISYLKQVMHFVFGAENASDSGDCIVAYDNPARAVASLKRLFDEKITVNLIHAEALVRACMVVDDPNRSYNMPVGGMPFKFCNARKILFNRSLSAAAAYQNQKDIFRKPASYLVRDRPPHPLDPLI